MQLECLGREDRDTQSAISLSRCGGRDGNRGGEDAANFAQQEVRMLGGNKSSRKNMLCCDKEEAQKE